MAVALHVSRPSLQGRRSPRGATTFSDVLDEVRESEARALVAKPEVPLAEIAYRLGFSDLAAFSRAFKRWTGQPPGMLRRSLVSR